LVSRTLRILETWIKARLFTSGKLILLCERLLQPPLFSNGYENLKLKISTYFSFGFYFKASLIPGISSNGNQYICSPTAVCLCVELEEEDGTILSARVAHKHT
jgi:hypothetical protein